MRPNETLPNTPSITRLSDYIPPSFEIKSVSLDFDLSPQNTLVKSKMDVKRLSKGPLELNGEDITLKSVKIDGRALKRSEYRLTQTHLIFEHTPDDFILEIENSCNPAENSTLMGLYVSTGRFCTQCEAEGFRRITYYVDRPDVLSVFTVKITGDKTLYPYLLSNGNMTDSGKAPDGKHYAVWEDPFPKPCYLFALVAGQFDVLEDNFTTHSNRNIPLTIYVDPGDSPRAEYAMDALKRSMSWDEQAYGREYDLDRFMIVAVRDFNFGAMENKGLNIFNSALLLADQASATDMNFERIESVVAHEYFHNWTGNRITCRDWFQLCLKEGFTVFRDQEFSADQRGAAVQRIKDVRMLRNRQFPEDAGPLAHPVRPNAFVKIDNFYTATIYEKGAELIRMLKIILGDDAFRNGCNHYFDTLDGSAATVEQFIACFEATSGQDLSQFMRWYEQAGTPTLKVKRAGTKIEFEQILPATPGQNKKAPQVIPVKWQVIGDDGALSELQVTILTTQKTTVDLPKTALKHEPFSLSLIQDFSAPVILDFNQDTDSVLRLMANDPNAFNRWEAGQSLARKILMKMAKAIETGRPPKADIALSGYVSALGKTLEDKAFNDSFKALALTCPSAQEIQQNLDQADPIAIDIACHWLNRAIADGLRHRLLAKYHELQKDNIFSPDAASAGRRALKNRCLSLLACRQDPQAASLAISQFTGASNMTDEISALVTLDKLGGRRVDQSMDDFYKKWEKSPLVIDKWFAVQAARKHPNGTEGLKALTQHKAYDPRNPNRVRALIGGFAMGNPHLFHHISGDGYRFFTQQVLEMDTRNPSVAARLLGAYEIWRKLDKGRQRQIKAELETIIKSKPSKNVLEIATKTLG